MKLPDDYVDELIVQVEEYAKLSMPGCDSESVANYTIGYISYELKNTLRVLQRVCPEEYQKRVE